MRIDLHTHSDVSDGTDTPEELVRRAASLGLDVVALCDHDTFDGLARATATGQDVGIEVVRGIEISAGWNGASVHVLGYGCRSDAPELAAELLRVRQGRTDRVPQMLAKLEALGMPIPADVLAAQIGDSPSVGRPHIADAMVELGYVADRSAAFSSWLADDKPIFVDRYAIELTTALSLIRAAGGAAVIAHPWGRGSRAQLSVPVLTHLADSGLLDGIEVDHQDHDSAVRDELRALTVRCGLLATGSSDYHGSGKVDHELGCNTTAPSVLAELRSRVLAGGGCW